VNRERRFTADLTLRTATHIRCRALPSYKTTARSTSDLLSVIASSLYPCSPSVIPFRASSEPSRSTRTRTAYIRNFEGRNGCVPADAKIEFICICKAIIFSLIKYFIKIILSLIKYLIKEKECVRILCLASQY